MTVGSSDLASGAASEFAALAQAMPGACRALSRHDDTAPQVAPRTVLDAFLRVTVDELVRRTVAPRRGTAQVTFDSTHDRWMHALRAADGSRFTHSDGRSHA